MASMRIAAACVLLLACTDRGAFSFAWEITLDTQPASCLEAGVATIELESSDDNEDGGMDVLVETYACETMSATTSLHEPNIYSISVTALDGSGGFLARVLDVDECFEGQTTDLGTYVLAVETEP